MTTTVIEMEYPITLIVNFIFLKDVDIRIHYFALISSDSYIFSLIHNIAREKPSKFHNV